MLVCCLGCGGLMARRSDEIDVCIQCREIRDRMMWARARELKAKLDLGALSDWPTELVDQGFTHARCMAIKSKHGAMITFDDLTRPYYREVMRERGYF